MVKIKLTIITFHGIFSFKNNCANVQMPAGFQQSDSIIGRRLNVSHIVISCSFFETMLELMMTPSDKPQKLMHMLNEYRLNARTRIN